MIEKRSSPVPAPDPRPKMFRPGYSFAEPAKKKDDIDGVAG